MKTKKREKDNKEKENENGKTYLLEFFERFFLLQIDSSCLNSFFGCTKIFVI